MPGLIGGIARTAVVAGTATAVSNRVSRRQAGRWAAQDQSHQRQPYLPPPPGLYRRPMYQPPPHPHPPANGPAPDDMTARLAQLQQLGELNARGILTDAELEAQKRKILGR